MSPYVPVVVIFLFSLKNDQKKDGVVNQINFFVPLVMIDAKEAWTLQNNICGCIFKFDTTFYNNSH